MQDLRDKLLNAGLVDKKSKRKAEQKARKKKKRSGGIRLAEERAEQERREAFEAQRLRDAAENRKREAERRAAFDRKEKLLRATYIAEANAIREHRRGPRKFYFATRAGLIKRFEVSQALGVRLELGRAAIVERPFSKSEPFGMVGRETVERIIEVDPGLVRFFNEEGPSAPSEVVQEPQGELRERIRQGPLATESDPAERSVITLVPAPGESIALAAAATRTSEEEGDSHDSPQTSGTGGPGGLAAVELVETGRLRLSGGCLAHTTAEILLEPRGDDVMVTVDNGEGHLPELPPRVENLWPTPEVSRFLGRLLGLVADQGPSADSDRMATLELDLPLADGRLQRRLVEDGGPPPMEPILCLVQELVAEVAEGEIFV